MEVGLHSPYDCSGYVIDVLSKVIGQAPEAWSPHKRHVRQMCEPSKNQLTQWAQLDLGDFAILGRIYTLGNKDRLVPAHIGIVVDRDADRGMLKLSHAQSKLGYVATSIVSFEDPQYELIGKTKPEQLLC